jgi:hypothetical protein
VKINKKESVTEKAPRQEKGVKKHTFDANEGGAKRTTRKAAHHVTTLTNALHGKDPYIASHKL